MYVTSSPEEDAALRTHLAINASIQRARVTDGPDTRRHDVRRIAYQGTLGRLRATRPIRVSDADARPRLLVISGRGREFVTGLLPLSVQSALARR
jgi:hypothetical protein